MSFQHPQVWQVTQFSEGVQKFRVVVEVPPESVFDDHLRHVHSALLQALQSVVDQMTEQQGR